MNRRIRLQHLSAIPITNGLGLSGQHDNRVWPRYVRTTDIAGPRSLRDDVFASQPPEVAEAAMLAPNDIIACAAGTVGKSMLFTSEDPACFAGFLVRIRPNADTDPRFLSYWMQSKDYWAQIEQGVVKSTIENFSASRFRAMSAPYLALEEQRRIADFLDDRVSRIDRIIAARREQIHLLDDEYEAWLQHHVDELGGRHGWAPLRRLGLTIEQGWSPEADSTPANPGAPGVLKLGAVRGGSFRPQENKGFLDGTEPKQEYLLRRGDLLVTRANTPALVGEAAVIDDIGGSPLYLSDLIYRLEIDGMDHTLAAAGLRTSRSRQEIGIIARGTSSSMPKLRGADLAGFSIPAVPKDLQVDAGRADSRRRDERDRRIMHLEGSIDLLMEYKSSLITAAVTGELDVSTAGSSIPG